MISLTVSRIQLQGDKNLSVVYIGTYEKSTDRRIRIVNGRAVVNNFVIILDFLSFTVNIMNLCTADYKSVTVVKSQQVIFIILLRE